MNDYTVVSVVVVIWGVLAIINNLIDVYEYYRKIKKELKR